jgi:hypothetical protein
MRKLEQKFLMLIEFCSAIIQELWYSEHFREKFILLMIAKQKIRNISTQRTFVEEKYEIQL